MVDINSVYDISNNFNDLSLNNELK